MDKARAVLAEAGWKERNADGLLVRNGQPFVFELLTNQANDERKKVAEIAQASLKELGVQVDIRVIEWASFLKEHITKRRVGTIIPGPVDHVDAKQPQDLAPPQTHPGPVHHGFT